MKPCFTWQLSFLVQKNCLATLSISILFYVAQNLSRLTVVEHIVNPMSNRLASLARCHNWRSRKLAWCHDRLSSGDWQAWTDASDSCTSQHVGTAVTVETAKDQSPAILLAPRWTTAICCMTTFSNPELQRIWTKVLSRRLYQCVT